MGKRIDNTISTINKLLGKKDNNKFYKQKEYFGYRLSDVLDGKKEKQINEYGLEIDYINLHLTQLFNHLINEGGFLYARSKGEDNGSLRFDLVEKSKLYEKNITHKERVLYYDKEFINAIRPYFLNSKVQNIIELGPGLGEKFPEYRNKGIKEYDPDRPINAPHIQKNDKNYYTIDISPYSIDSTKGNYESRGIKLEAGVIGDFFGSGKVPWNLENQGYVFLGGSIGNFYNYRIQELLERMQSNQKFYSVPALITYFSPPDKKKLSPEEYQNKILELKATYGDPDKNNPYYNQQTHQTIKNFIMGGFQALGLPIDKLELLVDYAESPIAGTPAHIKVGVQILEDFTIKVGYQSYHGSKGHTLRAIQSQRFCLEDWKYILEDSGFTIKENFNNDGVSAMLIKSKIGYHNKFKNEKYTIVSLALFSLLTTGSIAMRNAMSDQLTKEKVEKINLKDLKDKRIILNSYNDATELSLEEREARLNNTASDIYNSLEIRYGSGKLSQNDMIEFIKDDLSQQENLSMFCNSGNYNTTIIEYTDMFVKKHKRFLEKKGINTIPYYETFRVSDDKFKNVINCKGNEKSFNQHKIILVGGFRGSTDLSGRKVPLGRYQTKLGDIYDLGTFSPNSSSMSVPPSVYMSGGNVPDFAENFIYASPFNEEIIKERGSLEYTLNYSQIVAYDYFEQSRPITGEILDYFYKIFMGPPNDYHIKSDYQRYYKHNNSMGYGYEYKIGNTARELIIKDLVNTGMIYKIQPGDNDAILDYLSLFYSKYKDSLSSRGVTFVRPYENLYPYMQAFYNTLSSDKVDPTVIFKEDREKYNFQYLGSYTTANQKDYDIAVVEINKLQYIAAREKDKEDIAYCNQEIVYQNNYFVSFYGQDVAKDYIKLQRKFGYVAKYTPPQTFNVKNNSNKFQNIKPDSKSKGFTFNRQKK